MPVKDSHGLICTGFNVVQPEKRIAFEKKQQMASTKTTKKTLFALLVANLVPLVGLLLFEWDLISVFAAYMLETALVGLFALVRIIAVFYGNKPGKVNEARTYATAASPFRPALRFVVHFYFILFVQSLVFLVSVGLLMPETAQASSVTEYLVQFLQHETLISLLALFAGHSIVLFSEMFSGSLWVSDPNTISGRPYLRLFVQQFAVILGGFIMILLSNLSAHAAMIAFGAGFVLLKMVFEFSYQSLSEKANVSTPDFFDTNIKSL